MSSSIIKPLGDPAGDGKLWHVIYVRARHEKRVHEDLTVRRIESYLPLRKEIHQWSDRKRWIEVPLFSSYVFVRILPEESNAVYLTAGFVKFVSTNGKPSVIPDRQIEDIRRVIDCYSTEVEVLEGSYAGSEAEVIAGPLSGLRGEIIELVNGKTFVIRIDGLDKLLNVKVPVNAVRLVDESAAKRTSQKAAGGTAIDAAGN